jgi:hypothetical protein
MNIQWFRKLSRPVNSYFDLLLSIFYDYIKEERSPGYGESDPCEYSRLLTCEKSGLELGLALAPALWATWRPRKLTSQKS